LASLAVLLAACGQSAQRVDSSPSPQPTLGSSAAAEAVATVDLEGSLPSGTAGVIATPVGTPFAVSDRRVFERLACEATNALEPVIRKLGTARLANKISGDEIADLERDLAAVELPLARILKTNVEGMPFSKDVLVAIDGLAWPGVSPIHRGTSDPARVIEAMVGAARRAVSEWRTSRLIGGMTEEADTASGDALVAFVLGQPAMRDALGLPPDLDKQAGELPTTLPCRV
jgi:hypothetical protein